jgi:hypothetical protein
VTLLIAMVTNLLILPSLLLTLNKILMSKSFVEPYFEVYTEESDIDWSDLQLSTDEDLELLNPPKKEDDEDIQS